MSMRPVFQGFFEANHPACHSGNPWLIIKKINYLIETLLYYMHVFDRKPTYKQTQTHTHILSIKKEINTYKHKHIKDKIMMETYLVYFVQV